RSRLNSNSLWENTEIKNSHRIQLQACTCAEERDELAASHSITSSARARNESGRVNPIPLAVLRLRTSSNFVACSTGKSAGFVPLKILSMKYAARQYIYGRSSP